MQFLKLKKRLIVTFGLIILVLVWLTCRIIYTEHSTKDFPDYATIKQSNSSWSKYSKLSQVVTDLGAGWLNKDTNSFGEPVAKFGQKITGTSLAIQIDQIHAMFQEEKSFHENELSQSQKLYREKFQQEMAQEFAVKATAFKNLFDKDIKARELETQDSVTKFKSTILNEYQVELANLQLQLLLVDLSKNQKDPVLETQRIQSRIDFIHRDMQNKISMKQRQLLLELQEYQNQRQAVLNSELIKLRSELETIYVQQFNEYEIISKISFDNWLQQRRHQIQRAIDIRNSNNK